ncbi:long-chain fatty acid transport protein 2-like [Babylonia areolata]|uniref:long-chain fatty acid transport protein 2-like n=1 Tax=Babylonia areolata TaxID=304850 RepID=UPI003FD15B9E
MPLSVHEKALLGVAGAAGAGLLAWQTAFPWIKYDVQMIQVGLRMKKTEEDAMAGFLIDKFEAHVARHPHKAMLIYEDFIYTYEFVNQQANRVANIAQQLGLKFGDSIAVMIHNEPAYAWTLLGLQKMGMSVALINFNLRFKPLSHSVLATEPKAFIVGSGGDLLHAVTDILEDLHGLPVYVQGQSPSQLPAGMTDFDSLMERAMPVQPDPSVRAEMTYDSVMTYIYTSGTTGLPKPVYIRQLKANGMAGVFRIFDLTPEDIIYTVLPLYHSAGGGLGFYSLLYKGCTMVLRSKFSASHFWSDCRQYNVTVVQYIGEIFRYILAQPKHELDAVHKVRVAFGNGLRKDIFEDVVKRFKVPMVCEFFGATEGVTTLFNLANRPGAIGRVSPFMNLIDPLPKYLVKFDYGSAMPIRDKNGHCIKVKPGETGLFICKVPDVLAAKGDLVVYKASKEANDKKLVRNAFKDGDLYFNFGDVFYQDSDYFVYFHDRIGDTFRWKGENVSTTEVANVVAMPDFIHDANVYGVRVAGHDGRAGMAALTLNTGERITSERLREIYQVCEDDLPSYARPLFLRILPEAVLTGTFKQRKVELAQQGYDLAKVKDDLYYLDSKAKTYSPLTAEALVSFLQSKL